MRVQRNGPPQQTIVRRNYPFDRSFFRAATVRQFGEAREALPFPFRTMKVIELKPPNYPPDWVATWVDPGGFLEPYKKIPGEQRSEDLLIEEPTSDIYWPSEYQSPAGPVKFRCGFILHLKEGDPRTTEIQVYEKVPEIWTGEHWAFLHHGIGIGKVHDIRFVEPTVTDRIDMLNLLSQTISNR